MRTDAFDFDLPEERIALRPARPRESARLLVVDPKTDRLEGRLIGDLPRLLRAGDLLVLNDTKVIPARLHGVRERAGGNAVQVEANLHRRMDSDRWTAFLRPGKRLRPDDEIRFGELSARLVEKYEGGEALLAFDRAGEALEAAIQREGVSPLPPYIAARRAPDEEDKRDYQTIYADEPGSCAAPTAGLHFNEALMDALTDAGVETCKITLHVGAGTFLPVKAADTDDHRMHAEWRQISQNAADRINRVKAAGGRIIAIGSTALRSIESAADETGRIAPCAGETSIFLTPGARFKVVDGMITNFHLPRSTLFMLVAAFSGLDRMRRAYAYAIENEYRFYSYGDANLLWRAD